MVSFQREQRSRPDLEAREQQQIRELAAPAARRLATGKIDGCLQPSNSLVRHLCFRGSAYVNTDCGKRVLGRSHRIQVDALKRMATTERSEIDVQQLAAGKQEEALQWNSA